MEATSHKEEEVAFSFSQIGICPDHILHLDIEEVAAAHKVKLDSEMLDEQSHQPFDLWGFSILLFFSLR